MCDFFWKNEEGNIYGHLGKIYGKTWEKIGKLLDNWENLGKTAAHVERVVW